MPPHLLNHRFRGWLRRERFVHVLVVDVVAHAHELAVVVGAGEQDDGYAEDFGGGDAGGVGGVGFEDEFVYADGDGADEEGVEFLVVLGAVGVGLVAAAALVGGSVEVGLRGCGADVCELPLQVLLERF